jgi:hypothetical protein
MFYQLRRSDLTPAYHPDYFRKFINKSVVVSAEVMEVRINENAGKLRLNIFLDSGSTMTTSFGNKKYALLVSMALSWRLSV